MRLGGMGFVIGVRVATVKMMGGCYPKPYSRKSKDGRQEIIWCTTARDTALWAEDEGFDSPRNKVCRFVGTIVLWGRLCDLLFGLCPCGTSVRGRGFGHSCFFSTNTLCNVERGRVVPTGKREMIVWCQRSRRMIGGGKVIRDVVPQCTKATWPEQMVGGKGIHNPVWRKYIGVERCSIIYDQYIDHHYHILTWSRTISTTTLQTSSSLEKQHLTQCTT